MSDPSDNNLNCAVDPNALISSTLRSGVGVSFMLLLAGLAWTIVAPGAGAHGPVARNPVTGAIHGNVVLLLAGLMALMATPIMRIFAALWYFSGTGEKRYARACAFVLAGLASGVVISLLQRSH